MAGLAVALSEGTPGTKGAPKALTPLSVLRSEAE